MSQEIEKSAWNPISRRDRKLTFGIDETRHKGIEIGALNNPIIPPSAGLSRFIDYTDTDGLKKQHQSNQERVNGIVNVDYIWSGSGSLASVVGQENVFDFAIASHVIEHVPNTLGWFRGIFEVLRPEGIFNLAIPDKRYTFDTNCQLSTIGQLIEADLYSYERPSVRQMFDHCVHIAAIDPGAIWKENINTSELKPYNGDFALWLAQDQAHRIHSNNEYFDSHCWIYTPTSFLSLLRAAVLLEKFKFEIVNFHNTEPGQFEFFISLRKPDAHTGAEDLKWKQIGAIDKYQKALDDERRRASLSAL
ncbi:methyltransferase domain-containing protein [Methylobacterium sp. AMS5]|uniref:class I SAM-dependent methyltransferase n=1 Tax=Methylobacterium sp. AMS5 TaxID=925818 RepID=UPI00074F99CA|nr:methyltransferase domain-containing protein [Methylobacterium sp. AMS5]AMB45165.1 hypothetical protein Y590_09648 [Methylobacterium sp. AMS5]